LFRAAVHDRLDPDGSASAETDVDDDDAARLIVGLADVHVRDELLTWFGDEWGDVTRGLLVELVRRAVPPHDVAPLTVFGWLCYLQGEGVLAGIAVDRALAAEPDYGLAQILDQALSGALNPEVFRSALRRPQSPSRARPDPAAAPPLDLPVQGGQCIDPIAGREQ
jgi:hypothetical protein